MATSALSYQGVEEVPIPILKPHSDVHNHQIVVYRTSTCNYHGQSPQSESSRPICGFVALNCVRLAMKLEAEGLSDMALVQRVISSSMNDEVMSITNDLQADNHLSVEELLKVPIFEESLVSTTALSTIPRADSLNDIISKWFPLISTKVHAAVFSNSEEIVVCLRIPVLGSSIYALFDSHSRPSHPNQPAFTMSSRLDEVLTALGQILFSAIPNDPLSDTHTKLQFSAHLIESRPSICSLNVKDGIKRSVNHLSGMSSNPDALAAPQYVRGEHMASLRSQAGYWRKQQRVVESSVINSKGTSRSTSRTPSENKRVQNSSSETHRRSEFGWQLSLLTPEPNQDQEGNDLEGMEGSEDLPFPAPSLGVENKENIPPSPSLSSSSRRSDFPWMKSLILSPDRLQFGQGDHPNGADDDNRLVKNTTRAGPSGLSHLRSQEFSWQRALEGTTLRETEKKVGKATSYSDSFDEPEGSHPQRHEKTHHERKEKVPSAPKSDYAWQTALLQQLQEEEELAASVAPNTSRDQVWLVALQKRIQEDHTKGHGASSSALTRSDLDWQLAVQLQAEEEGNSDNNVGSSSTFNTLKLPTSTPTTFECGVCGELHDLSEKIGLDGCGHAFCKICLGTFTKTKIEEGRYPIFCPECLPDRSMTTKTQITQEIVDQLNLRAQDLERLEELQLVAHSVVLQCPRCTLTMNVDREQYGEENTLVCPLPRCGHKWCKTCNKTVASSEDNHRCKNGNIDRLVRRKGWRYCPGCTTPVQKESGCNHMTCGSPACNTHFCYKCGVSIIDTTNGGDVGTAVTDHYVNCQLFEKRLRCSIQ